MTGVEHLDDRQPPGAPQFAGHQTGKPVVAVDYIVLHALPPHKIEHALGELRQVFQHTVLVAGFFRPRWHMDHPPVRPQPVADAADVGILRPGEAVDRDPSPPQLAAQVTDVDVHAPCFFATESRQGTGMNAEHGNMLNHKAISDPPAVRDQIVVQAETGQTSCRTRSAKVFLPLVPRDTTTLPRKRP